MHNVSIDNEAMAKYMSTDDVVCTASAIQNRVKKLRAMAKEEGSDVFVSPSLALGFTLTLGYRLQTVNDGATKAKATPRKRVAAAENADGESPAKKGKGKGGKGKAGGDTVKKEQVEDDEVV